VASITQALSDRKHSAADGSLKPSMPFVVAGRLWLKEQHRPEADLSANTLRAYEGAFNRYVDVDGCPLRGMSLTQANSVKTLRPWLQRVADEHGSGAAKMARNVLSGILGMAVHLDVLQVNAARQTGVPRAMVPRASKRDNRRSLTDAERSRALEVADDLARRSGADPRTARKWQLVADLMAFLAGTGVRIAEARLLRWEHVNLDVGAVEIHGTKTKASLRGLNVPDWLKVRLQRRAREGGQRGLVFAAPALAGGDEVPVDAENLQHWVRDVLDKAGLEWATSHSFRRTVASRLHAQGVPLVRIADQLGHANPTMTADVYLGRDLRGDKADLAALL